MAWLWNGLVALGLGVFAHSVSADDTTAETLSARWMSAYNSGDLEALAAIYATDARVQHGYCPAVLGRDAIAEFWDGDVVEGAETQLYIVDSFELDELVYVSGRYAVNDPHISEDGPVGGTYTQIWRRSAGTEWSLYRESWVNLVCVKVRSGPDSPDEAPGIAL